jgi:hypothetical protein
MGPASCAAGFPLEQGARAFVSLFRQDLPQERPMTRLPQDFTEDNSEQQDPGQAQDVAAEAIDQTRDPSEPSARRGGDPGALLPDDVPDLVDTMNAMIRNGQIDNGAYAGEPMMDDEEGMLGETDSDEDE